MIYAPMIYAPMIVPLLQADLDKGAASAEFVREVLIYRYGSWENVRRHPDGRAAIEHYLSRDAWDDAE